MRKTLITSGCGISQKYFPHYPIWTHFPKLTYQLEHISVGAPAAGNEFIGRILKKHIYENNHNDLAVIAQWTAFGKADIFVEDQELLDEISNYETRNFINDLDANTHNYRGFWASSVSKDNNIKQNYNKVFNSKIYRYLKDVEYILDIQTLCKAYNIPYLFLLGYDYDTDFMENCSELKHLLPAFNNASFSSNLGYTTSIMDHYKTSDSYHLDLFKFDTRYQSPNSLYHHDLYFNQGISSFLSEHFLKRRLQTTDLYEYCSNKAHELYDNLSSTNK
jgi:hypothetical protein